MEETNRQRKIASVLQKDLVDVLQKAAQVKADFSGLDLADQDFLGRAQGEHHGFVDLPIVRTSGLFGGFRFC